MKNIKYGLLCFIPSAILLLFYDFISDKIATHFYFYEQADILSSKWYIILLMPMLGFVGHVLHMIILEKNQTGLEERDQRSIHFYRSLY